MINLFDIVKSLLKKPNKVTIDATPVVVDVTKLLPRPQETASMIYVLKGCNLVINPYEKKKKKPNLQKMLMRNIASGRLLEFKGHQIWHCYEMTRAGTTIEVAHLYTGQHLLTLQGINFPEKIEA